MENVTDQKELKEINNGIINTLITQLGGHKFFLMTGSKPQYKSINTVNPLIALKLVKNQSKANYLTITYMSGIDTYKMEFIRMTKDKREIVKELDNIYADQLQEIFTEVTGLYTTL